VLFKLLNTQNSYASKKPGVYIPRESPVLLNGTFWGLTPCGKAPKKNRRLKKTPLEVKKRGFSRRKTPLKI